MNKEILKNFSYGIYALGYKNNNIPNACIINTAFQVTSSPACIAISVNHKNYSCSSIKKDKYFTISILSEDTSGAVIGALGFNSGRSTNKLKNIKHRILDEGVPIIKENTCSWVLCKLKDYVETNSHTIFIGEIIAGSEKSTGVPMTYKYYREVIKGTAPINAPTHIQNENKTMDTDIYVCEICGYVYNSKDIPFDELPDSWVCPVCGVSKKEFTIKR